MAMRRRDGKCNVNVVELTLNRGDTSALAHTQAHTVAI